jgi:hypothetical protein
MRQISYIFIVLITFLLSCDTAGNVDPVFQNYFIKYYGEDGNQEGADLLINADGSMILLGNSSSQTDPVPVPFLVKIDPLGNVLWRRQLGGLNERAVDVELDKQGNLIVLSNVGDESNSRIRLFRIDQQGNGIDSVKVEFNEKQVGRSVTQVSDNRFLVAGFSEADPNKNPISMPIPPPDEADIIVLQIDERLKNSVVITRQGGEHIGSGVKIFETVLDDSTKYLVFGDSDRPGEDGIYKRAFEVFSINDFGSQGLRRVSGINTEIQITSSVIEIPASLFEGYLMVGTTYASNNSSSIYLTRYTKTLDTRPLIPIWQDNSLLGRRLEGVSAAAAEPDAFFILANEIRENNKRDILLLKLASDGAVIGSTGFGTLEGDDMSAAVKVLGDGRVVVFGTLELETQKKMVLMVISPEGKFSN